MSKGFVENNTGIIPPDEIARIKGIDPHRSKLFFDSLQDVLPSKRYTIDRVAGGINMLGKIILGDASEPSAIVKFYSDDKGSSVSDKLRRESSALVFFSPWTKTPDLITHSEEGAFGIHSFETGIKKTAAQLSDENVKDQIDCLVEMHDMRPRTAFLAGRSTSYYTLRLSLSDYATIVQVRLDESKEAAEARQYPPHFMYYLDEKDILERVHVAAANTRVGGRVDNFNPADSRFSHNDFGVHNMLFQPDSFLLLDWEESGFNDPTYDLSNFLLHNQMADLSQEHFSMALNRYRERADLPAELLEERLQLVLRLVDLEWVLKSIGSLRPEKIAQRRFGNRAFDLDEFTRQQIHLVDQRLQRLEIL